MNNPFTLAFDIKPNNYIPRIKQSEEIIENFRSITGNKIYFITGVRGVGKTALFADVLKEFDKEEDWIVIELNTELELLEQFAAKLYDYCSLSKIITAKSFDVFFSGVTFSLNGKTPITNILSLIELLLEKTNNAQKKILLGIDDVHNNYNIKTFIKTFQLLIRKYYNINLLATGLYQNIHELQNDKDLTFLYRAPIIQLKSLNLAAIAHSYKELLNIGKEEALMLAKATKGYAYAYQVLGHLVWKAKSPELDDGLYAKYDQYLEEYVYEKIYYELSTNDKVILKSFKSDSVNSVDDLLESSNMKKNVFSVYRDRLIKRGIIEAPEYGKLVLKLPRFYEFIERQI